MNDTLNDAIDQIIINLKTIGKIKINDKIYINNGFIMIQKESFYRPLVRSMYGYSREQSCVLIQEVVMKAIRASVTLLNIENITSHIPIQFLNYLKLMINLRDSFSTCKEGLCNFIRTYEQDQTIVSRAENLIYHINNQLSIIDSKLEHNDYKMAIQKYFPAKLEQFITNATPPSYQKYYECNNNASTSLNEKKDNHSDGSVEE